MSNCDEQCSKRSPPTSCANDGNVHGIFALIIVAVFCRLLPPDDTQLASGLYSFAAIRRKEGGVTERAWPYYLHVVARNAELFTLKKIDEP